MKDEFSNNLCNNEIEGSQVSSKAVKWLKTELQIDITDRKFSKKE